LNVALSDGRSLGEGLDCTMRELVGVELGSVGVVLEQKHHQVAHVPADCNLEACDVVARVRTSHDR